MSFDFGGKVALVTGAGSGIGEETALKFAANGAMVVVSDIDQASGTAVVERIRNHGGEAVFIACDVGNAEQVESLIQKTVQQYGQLNIACNNAGIEGENGLTDECSLDNFQKVMDVNVRGVWLCMKYEIPHMVNEGGGAIVNLSSIAGLIGFPGLPAYVASKHAVAGLTKTAALEYARSNVRVNAVCPGPIMTPMLERIMGENPEFKENLLAGVPEHRIGEPADVADTILYLCSAQATYITGQCLAIDGGWVAQ
ncbi:MAG: SDR family oxidoreductase [Pseudohongiellaceae bacterium]